MNYPFKCFDRKKMCKLFYFCFKNVFSLSSALQKLHRMFPCFAENRKRPIVFFFFYNYQYTTSKVYVNVCPNLYVRSAVTSVLMHCTCLESLSVLTCSYSIRYSPDYETSKYRSTYSANKCVCVCVCVCGVLYYSN